MNKLSKMLVVGLMLSVSAAFAWVAAAKVTMTGQYQWNRQADKPGDLRAEFTSIKDGQYQVNFYFEFREKKHVYSGTAEGSIENGALKGEVQNENKKRTWRFKGISKDGKFTGTHVEMKRDGGEKATGTLTLSMAK